MSENFNKTGLEILGLSAPQPEKRRDAIQAMRETDRPPVLHRVKRAFYALCADKVSAHTTALTEAIDRPRPAEESTLPNDRDTRIFTVNLGIAQLTARITHDD